MFFSATLDGAVGELARAYTNSPSRFESGPAHDEPGDIEHSFVSVTFDTKLETLVRHLEEADGLTLVFVRTKRGADQLVKKLARQQVDAVAMQGDLSQPARERSLARFEEGRVKTLVATDVAARGLDLDDIKHVINYDPPAEHTSYVHRTGRTGRAGRSGKAVTFVLPDQQAETSHVARRLGHREQFEEAGLRSARPKLVYSGRRRRGSKW
jgi:superfamily II DNA/RNA helicase